MRSFQGAGANAFVRYWERASCFIMPGVVIDSMEVYEELVKYIAGSNYNVK